MEVKIGVQYSPRELIVDSALTPEEVDALVAQALESDGALRLTDLKGRHVIVPAAKISYVEISTADERRIGFIS